MRFYGIESSPLNDQFPFFPNLLVDVVHESDAKFHDELGPNASARGVVDVPEWAFDQLHEENGSQLPPQHGVVAFVSCSPPLPHKRPFIPFILILRAVGILFSYQHIIYHHLIILIIQFLLMFIHSLSALQHHMTGNL